MLTKIALAQTRVTKFADKPELKLRFNENFSTLPKNNAKNGTQNGAKRDKMGPKYTYTINGIFDDN